ncbi:hypothetical protein O6H91_17G035800 [Diphasiastrum complanatum]|uniref:Uncharacterized protein n=1 Tax=Diphasiastrum complanatum TaxID=34168 RepID=A0ACC2B5P5_DIPCM|nr:hypothetical protein O6H91_17G035800 [Diphasiastrum complanatum]
MPTATVKVSNLSVKATKQDVLEFFSFSGEIQHVELHSDGESSQIAFVTFKDHEALDTALLLSTEASAANTEEKTQTVIANMLAKGYILGKDAMSSAKAFDEKHKLTANASATVSNLDKKIGLSEKINAGTAAVNQGVKSVDEKYHVSEKTKQAFAAAEQTVQNAGSALMKNKYILTGATWVTGAFSKVAKAANDVTQKTKEKVQSNESLNQGTGHEDHVKEEELSRLS